MKKGLTFTVIAQAQSLNYGEGIGNIAELKKLTRADGNVYTFASLRTQRAHLLLFPSISTLLTIMQETYHSLLSLFSVAQLVSCTSPFP